MIKWVRSLGIYFMLSSAGYCLWYISNAEEIFCGCF